PLGQPLENGSLQGRSGPDIGQPDLDGHLARGLAEFGRAFFALRTDGYEAHHGVVDVGLFAVGKADLVPIAGLSGAGQHRSPLCLLNDAGAEGGAAPDVGHIDRHLQFPGGGFDFRGGASLFPAVDMNGRADWNQIVQFDDVLVVHADAAVGGIGSDAFGLVRAVNAVGSPVVSLDADAEPPFSQRIVRVSAGDALPSGFDELHHDGKRAFRRQGRGAAGGHGILFVHPAVFVKGQFVGGLVHFDFIGRSGIRVGGAQPEDHREAEQGGKTPTPNLFRNRSLPISPLFSLPARDADRVRQIFLFTLYRNRSSPGSPN